MVDGKFICMNCFEGLNYSIDSNLLCTIKCPNGQIMHPKNSYVCVDVSQDASCPFVKILQGKPTCVTTC